MSFQLAGVSFISGITQTQADTQPDAHSIGPTRNTQHAGTHCSSQPQCNSHTRRRRRQRRHEIVDAKLTINSAAHDDDYKHTHETTATSAAAAKENTTDSARGESRNELR